jgi:hypothetical protein
LIEKPLSFNEFLNPKDEIIINKDGDIFIAIIEHYSINKPGKEEESSDKEEEEEIEQIKDAKALRIIERLRL